MKITYQQGLGRVNKDYWTALIWVEKTDKHVFIRKDKEKCNIMLKHSEVSMILTSLLTVESPDKRDKLKDMWIKAINDGMDSEVNYNENK